ncbi:MAG: hypothetical protein ACR2GL_05620 [Thermoleophilaceae bacterium]
MRRLLPILLLAVLALPVGADAAPAKRLWATVNVCDPPGARSVIGIRGSMPRSAGRRRMYMHFAAQYYSASRKRWIATGSSSRWIRVRRAGSRSGQAGYSFEFAEPPRGGGFLMRGVVSYRWTTPRAAKSGRGAKRRRWAVARRARRVTTGGYRGVVGAIPAGRSDAMCLIRR